ncbi:hypothetical protein BZB76_1109 [Actinomadura pelletieri DSM 43383]|uniref:Uncharacterized protein n=1 Tax=Actinomadura pelletieri DSM 43383 TaxID=1120940 RepID=A0A495R096_9ACTN|nr:hypothetical protein [Actinomadura pelletieri]RKS79634.1 hypothetical protein BZB76_1109 [Actinomadura pelletieri DSM 43383]
MLGDGPLPDAGLAFFLAYGALTAAEPAPPDVRDPWPRAAAALVRCNAESLALPALSRERPAPAPIDPVGLRPAELLALVRERETELADARRRYCRGAVGTALHLLTGDSAERLAVARALCRGDAESGADGAIVRRLHRRLALLDPETPPHERAAALDMAARALTADSTAAALSAMDRLARIVRAANESTRRRRADAVLAACYLQVLAVAPADPVATWVASRLTAVLDGDRALTHQLHGDAERWRARFEETAERAFEAAHHPGQSTSNSRTTCSAAFLRRGSILR